MGFYIHNRTNTSTPATTSITTTVTTTTIKDATIAEILITIFSIIAMALFVICCCYKWNKGERGCESY